MTCAGVKGECVQGDAKLGELVDAAKSRCRVYETQQRIGSERWM
jgi:hypothetical protein